MTKSLHRTIFRWLFSLSSFVWLCCTAHGAFFYNFDWDRADFVWTAGNLSASFEIDTENPGNDITITISGDTSYFLSGYPAKDTGLEGGKSPAENNLHTRLNWDQPGRSITITIDFHYAKGVDIATLTLFDVDAGNPELVTKGKNTGEPIPNTRQWVDVITNIQGKAVGGSTIYPSNVVGSGSNVVSGSGATWNVVGTGDAPNTGTGSGQGNVTISFGSNALTQVQYTWLAGNDSVADPAAQRIGIYDFSYASRIPEYHPGLFGASFCSLLIAMRHGRRCISRFFMKLRS